MKKKTSKKLLILFLTLNQYILQCEKGCLKCSKEDKCQICDITNFYKKNEKNQCEKKNLENCSQMSIKGDCLSCVENYYLDAFQKKCVILENLKKIENCFFYDSSQNCELCKKDFFFLAGICKGIEKKIENCEFYLSDGKCVSCENGFLLDFEGKKCDLIKDDGNCLFFSRVNCKTCKSGFVKNENLYIKNIFSFSSDDDSEKILEFLSPDIKKQKKIQICEKITTENCLKNITAEKCEICNEGYFLSETKKCVTYPISIIENCLQYSSNTKCKKCENKFFLQSVFECVKITEIEKCLEYDGTKNTTICQLCENGYFSIEKKCEKRENIIKNCKEFSKSADFCENCEIGFILTSEKKNCFSVIANCENYNFPENSISCKKCDSGYFLESEKCKSGNIKNCSEYTENTTCSKCENKYNLENNTCTLFQNINKCENYQNSKNCLKCEKRFFNFLIKKKCLTLTPIKNCLTYTQGSNPLTCDTCASTYIPSSTKNSCEKINTENCHFSNSVNNCTICEKNFALKDGKCFLVLEHMGKNCRESDVDGKNGSLVTNVLCENCKKNTLPVNHKDLFVCVKNENLGFYLEIVENCEKYDRLGICLECKEGFFLENGECVESCGSKDLLRYDFVSYKVNECFVENEGCEVKAKRVDGNGDICIKCKQGYFEVDLGYSNPSFTNFRKSKEGILIENHRALNYGINCVLLDGKTINAGSTTTGLIQNCILYKNRSSTIYDCIKCSHGFSGDFENTYIKNCTENPEFSKTEFFGLDLIWQKLFTTHKCQSPNNIPFLAYTETSPSNGFPLSLTTINPSKSQTAPNSSPQQKNTFCSSNTSNHSTNESIQIPTDCGLGVFRLSAQKTFTNFYCAACKPGYKGISVAGFEEVKSECVFVENCKGKEWFNGCSECSEGYCYKFDGDVDFGVCWAYSVNDSCFASDGNGECVLCKKGFVLNADSICDRVLPPNCESYEFFSIVVRSVDEMFFKGYKFFLQQKSRGCQKCKFGFTQVLISTSNYYVCSDSDFISKNSDVISTTSEFIKFCESYFFDSEYKCALCQENKLLDINKKKCVNKITGCEIASINDNQCNTCFSDYALINNTCVKGEIPNCLTYYNTINKDVIICKECQNEFYKETNELTCVKSAVLNCKSPLGLQKCSQCYDEFVLYNDLPFHYCYALDSTLECKNGTFKDSEVFGGEISCEECKNANQIFIVSENEAILQKTVCMEYNEIFKCKVYSDSGRLETSNFYCVECEEGFFLSSLTGSCKKRKIVENCKVYSLTDDVCLECDENSFVDQNGKICQSFPKGIFGCISYISEKECSKCSENTYLTMNTCQKIAETQKIKNCKYYKSSAACEECLENHALETNTCTKSSLSHCKTLKTSKTCEICQPGYGLKKAEDKTECLELSKQNCLSYNQNTPYPCLQCKSGFYAASDGFCKEADPIINNCLFYRNKEECEVCRENSVLSRNRKFCYDGSAFVGFKPDFCEESLELEVFCGFCKGGFFFEAGVCKECERREGCFGCDVDGACFVCRSGFFMDKEGVCQPDEVVDREVVKLVEGKEVFAGFWVFIVFCLFN